ncbi:MAG TPA: hypothetical protein VKZ95_08775 [Sphingobacteriaceae bacterium]|nr:hypothetical protein [Sphingobacteriaceae bacterium]
MSEDEGVTEHAADVQDSGHQEQMSAKEYNFRALEEKTNNLERQNQMLNAKLMEVERMKYEASQRQVEEPAIREDDIPTYGDIRKIRQKDQEELSVLKEQLNDLKMRSMYSDYQQTVKEYLPDVLKEDPELALAIKDNPMMHRLAYKLAQASPRYHQEKIAKNNDAAVNKIIENSSRPTPSNARKSATVQDEDAKLANMTEQQIWNMFNTAKARY